jgi:hypothetical protein
MTLASTVSSARSFDHRRSNAVVGRRKGGHVCGDRICPLLEQQRQILVP